jgi:hypothetical protein
VQSFRKLEVVTLRFEQFIKVLRLSRLRGSHGERAGGEILCIIGRCKRRLSGGQKRSEVTSTKPRPTFISAKDDTIQPIQPKEVQEVP